MEQVSVQPAQAGLGRTDCQLGLEEQGTDSHFFPSSTLSLTHVYLCEGPHFSWVSL